MAGELTLSASLTYAKGNITQKVLNQSATAGNAAGLEFAELSQTIPTTSGGTAINLGSLASVGWALIKNLDPTNYVTIMTAVSGNIIGRIPPQSPMLIYFDPGVTAPAALAHTASCQLEYLIAPI